MKRKTFLILISLIFIIQSTSSFSADELNKDKEEKPLIDEIADMNMKEFGWQNESWHEDDYGAYIKKSLKKRLEPKEKCKRSNAFEFFKKVEKGREGLLLQSVINNKTTWNDLTFFCGQNDVEKYLANVIDRTHVQLGKIFLFYRLAQPIADIEILLQRQEITKMFIDNPAMMANADSIFESLPQAENVFLSFWDQDDFKVQAKRDYFKIEKLNAYRHLLLAKSIFGHQERLGWFIMDCAAIAALVAYGVVIATRMGNFPKKVKKFVDRYNISSSPIFIVLSKISEYFPESIKSSIANLCGNRFVVATSSVGSGAYLSLRLKNFVSWIKGCFLFEGAIQQLIIQIAAFTKGMRKLYTLVKADPRLAQVKEFQGLIDFFEVKVKSHSALQELVTLLDSRTFSGKSCLFSHKGNVLRAYALMHELKEEFAEAAISVGAIDMYLSVAKLYKESENTNKPFCFAQYELAESPFIRLKDFWHPLIIKDEVIKNSLVIGCGGQRQNMIITGPNEGGKSTTLKAIATSLIMAQSLGIAPASEIIFYPFSIISTYLNITDDIGSGNSLFKAEVVRTQKLVTDIENLQAHQFSFVIFDEVFNGTTPFEGAASAYSVAEYLSKIPNSICLIATHFYLLTELEKNTKAFANYKVSATKYKGGGVKLHYKLEPGISDQHVAIDILQTQGFSCDILDKAREILQR